jgi:HSP20 family protein
MSSEVIIMTGLMRTETKPREVVDGFDRIFEDWMQGPIALLLGRDDLHAETIRVDEFHDNGNLVIRAELPGLDPEKDVEVTVADGLLHIEAHRREVESKQEKGYARREMRYGSFMRTLPLPEGVSGSDVTAGYKDGILEIKVPTPAPISAPTPEATKVAITKG